ncbi:GNAT family N-acetyltransferase, partial [Nostoc sp. NIES-2111]
EMSPAGKSPECGMVGYVDGAAVSPASVIVLHNVLYVALVATAPDHRQRGYADAVMRHALQTAATEFDLHHAALDASVMGEPIYAAMGFSPTGTDWRVLMAAHHD